MNYVYFCFFDKLTALLKKAFQQHNSVDYGSIFTVILSLHQ